MVCTLNPAKRVERGDATKSLVLLQKKKKLKPFLSYVSDIEIKFLQFLDAKWGGKPQLVLVRMERAVQAKIISLTCCLDLARALARCVHTPDVIVVIVVSPSPRSTWPK
jgi:hypothetical protein